LLESFIKNKLYYENYWDEYVTHSQHPSVKLRNRFILRQLKKIDFVSSADVGCGDGYLVHLIKNSYPGKKLWGLDLSKKVIELNSIKYEGIKFDQLDISKNILDYKHTFDVVICSEVIEHLINWQTALINLSSLLNDNGYLILTTQSGKIYQSDKDNGHLHHFELENLEKEFNKIGLRTICAFKKGYPFYNMQKWIYEKNEHISKEFHKGERGKSFLGKCLFNLTFLLFLLTPRSKKLGPQIFITARKELV